MRFLTISLLSLACISLTYANDPWKGDEYAKNSESQKSSADDFLKKMQEGAKAAASFSTFKGNEVILDVGCGDGKITAAIASKVPQGKVVGIDISPSMIDFAKKAFPADSNLTFQVQDAASLDYHEEFDLIASFTVMQWVTKQQDALVGFERALKPGGKLWIQMPMGLPTAMQQALSKVIAQDKWKQYFTSFQPPWNFFTRMQYVKLLDSAHLIATKLEITTKDEAFPSREAFQGFVKQWFPYLRALPNELKDSFMTDLVDNYLKALPADEQGRVHFIVDRLEVEALKAAK